MVEEFGAEHKIPGSEKKLDIPKPPEVEQVKTELAPSQVEDQETNEGDSFFKNKESSDTSTVELDAAPYTRETIAGKDCLVVKDRGEYKWSKDGEERTGDLPDVVFPKDYLGQKPMTAEQLEDAANWLVYKIDPETGEPELDEDGQPKFNELFTQIKEITEEDLPPFLRFMTTVVDNRAVSGLIRAQGIKYPYYESKAMIEIAKVAFGSRIKDEYTSDGSQYFYEVIGPVYDFFHQMNTQAVQQFDRGEFRHVGGLPVGIASREGFGQETEYYPNDAEGRDILAGNITSELSSLREAGEEGELKIMGVGDGPAITAFKTAEVIAESGISDVSINIVEFNDEQIRNGMRAYENLNAEQKRKLREHNIKVNWVRGDASTMPFKSDEFDVVFSSYVIGAMGGAAGEEVIRGYARESLRVLKKGGKHMTVDFYYEGDDMEKGYKNTEGVDESQAKLRKTFGRMKSLLDKPLKNCYHGIWDHNTKYYDALNDESEASGAEVDTIHKQNWFGHFPVARLGGRVLTFSVPGYNEMHSTITKA